MASSLIRGEGNPACVCGNCDWTGTAEDLNEAADLSERLDAGSVVPAGECPECCALAYLQDDGAAADRADALAILAEFVKADEAAAIWSDYKAGQGEFAAIRTAAGKARDLLHGLYIPSISAPTVTPDAQAALVAAERFIAGFEDDELQEGVPDLLYQVRSAINLPISETARDPLQAILSEFVASFGAAVDNDEEIQGSAAVDYLTDMVRRVRAVL